MNAGYLARDLKAPDGDTLAVIVGPTASGKTALALELAERWNGEVVGADSVQIYAHFDVGSGKPSAEEMARAKHHLVGVVEPLDTVDAGRFVALADQAIADIRSRGRVPIVCGGTFLWVKALISGLAPLPAADAQIRLRHQQIVEAKGRAALHAMLTQVDPESAARLAPNDALRVSRALEIFELSGKPQSAHFADHGFRGPPRHKASFLGVSRAREDVDRRIEARTRSWLAGPLFDEVRALLEAGYGDARAMGAVGYKQMREHLLGMLPLSDLEGAIVRATRVFVRRQRTWLRDQPVLWLEP